MRCNSMVAPPSSSGLVYRPKPDLLLDLNEGLWIQFACNNKLFYLRMAFLFTRDELRDYESHAGLALGR